MSNNMTALRISHLSADELAHVLDLTQHGEVSLLDNDRDLFVRLALVDWEGDLLLDNDLYEVPEGWQADAWGRLLDRFERTLERALVLIVEKPGYYGVDYDWLLAYGDNFRRFAEKEG